MGRAAIIQGEDEEIRWLSATVAGDKVEVTTDGTADNLKQKKRN